MPSKFLRPTVFSGGLSEKLKHLGKVNNCLSRNSIVKGNVNSYYVQERKGVLAAIRTNQTPFKYHSGTCVYLFPTISFTKHGTDFSILVHLKFSNLYFLRCDIAQFSVERFHF